MMRSFTTIFALFAVLLLPLLTGCQPDPAGPDTPPAAADESGPAAFAAEPEAESPPPASNQPPARPTPLPTTAPSQQPGETTPADINWPAGALISMRLDGTVGVLLDEFPAAMRPRVADTLLAEDEAIWLARATKQVELTGYRLHFRDYVYDKIGVPGKKQLPLPPRDLWQIELDPAGPRQETIDDNVLVVWDYTFTSTLLSDAASPAVAEPLLAEAGGVWEEPFILPADPSLLLQRTGNACVNEAGFPPNSYDSENMATFYDFSCQGDDGGMLGCHRTVLAPLSCTEAIRVTSGRVETAMVFERLPWDDALAAQVRRGDVVESGTPDLAVVGPELGNNRIVYRYFPPDSCALQEACVGAPGWRRLLLFDAMVHNVGTAGLDIGLIEGEDPETNLYEYDACHNHIHYSHYGDFLLSGQDQPAKRAFCVESTGRLSNNEFAPLTHDYSCRVQGIQTGWVDEYGAGLDCQWLDITDMPLGAAGEISRETLTFRANPDQLLCEGTPVVDDNGERIWKFSGLLSSDGHPISYPACTLIDTWDANNEASVPVALPASGSFVTEPCAGGETGPLRNCGFAPKPETFDCTPGATVELACRYDAAPAAAPQTLRVCDFSEALADPIACTFSQALANLTLPDSGVRASFTCPLPRSGEEPGGRFSLFTAATLDGDSSQGVSCEVVSRGS